MAEAMAVMRVAAAVAMTVLRAVGTAHGAVQRAPVRLAGRPKSLREVPLRGVCSRFAVVPVFCPHFGVVPFSFFWLLHLFFYHSKPSSTQPTKSLGGENP